MDKGSDLMEYARGEAPTGASDGHGGGNAS